MFSLKIYVFNNYGHNIVYALLPLITCKSGTVIRGPFNKLQCNASTTETTCYVYDVPGGSQNVANKNGSFTNSSVC